MTFTGLDTTRPTPSQRYVDVFLTWEKIETVAFITIQRAIGNLRDKRKDRIPELSWVGLDSHFLGDLGEAALNQHVDRFWLGNVGDLSAPDGSGGYQVRGVWRPSDHLVVYRSDSPDQPFVSALILKDELPMVRLRGWKWGRDAKLPKFWKTPQEHGVKKPGYFIEWGDLEPMATLPMLKRKNV